MIVTFRLVLSTFSELCRKLFDAFEEELSEDMYHTLVTGLYEGCVHADSVMRLPHHCENLLSL